MREDLKYTLQTRNICLATFWGLNVSLVALVEICQLDRSEARIQQTLYAYQQRTLFRNLKCLMHHTYSGYAVRAKKHHNGKEKVPCKALLILLK